MYITDELSLYTYYLLYRSRLNAIKEINRYNGFFLFLSLHNNYCLYDISGGKLPNHSIYLPANYACCSYKKSLTTYETASPRY